MADESSKRLNDAIAHLRAGRLSDADAQCIALLREQSNHTGAYEIRGLVAAQAGDYSAAARHFRSALDHAAKRSPATLANLAEALLRLNQPDKVIEALTEAIEIAPDYAIAWGKLAIVQRGLGRSDEALKTLTRGLEQVPDDPELSGILAGLLISLQRPAEAVPHLYCALERAPNIDDHWIYLYRLLLIGFLPVDRAGAILLKALEHPLIRPAMVAPSIAVSLAQSPQIAELMELVNGGGGLDVSELAGQLAILEKNELLLALMAVGPVPNPAFEKLFTVLRRSIALADDIGSIFAAAPRFLVALANQAFLTEYAWQATDPETERVEQLVSAYDVSAASEAEIVMIACFRPLNSLSVADAIRDRKWSDELQPLIRMQVVEPYFEQQLRADIPSLTRVDDKVSRKVKAQYEEHPYPRWVRAERMNPIPSVPAFIASLGGTVPETDQSFFKPDVLIAGCGTGQQVAVAALRYPNAKIVAADISMTSLAYAARRMREIGIDNVRFVQADILKLGVLDHQFHVIESSGVLHHLADPLRGWRVLERLLRPQGLMNIGLYSELARQDLDAARAYIAEKGYGPSESDIRQFRGDVLTMPEDHSLAGLTHSADFYDLSGCRDLLFHAQEHRFTLPKIRDAIDELGLEFLRFELPDYHGYRQRFPDDPRMTSLENWDAYERENPRTFSGMYQFWLQKRAN